MRVVVISKPSTDYARSVEMFLRDFQNQTGHQLEHIDPESPEGIILTETYDILEFPTLLALDDSGQVQNIWKGLPLPTMSEVSYYV